MPTDSTLTTIPRRGYEVIATNIKTGAKRLIAREGSEQDAEAIVRVVVMRRGVDEEVFSVVRAGSVQL